VALGTGLARERRLLITGEPPKQAEDRKKPNPSACPGLAEHLLPRRHGLIQSFPRRGEGISRSCVAAIIPNPLLLKILGFSLAQLATSRRWVSQNQVPDFFIS